MDEAVELVKRSPSPMLGPSEVEIRPVFEPADFGEAMTPQLADQEERLRDQIGRPVRPRPPHRHHRADAFANRSVANGPVGNAVTRNGRQPPSYSIGENAVGVI